MNYLLSGLTFLLLTGNFLLPAQTSAPIDQPFQVFDNMFYAGKPDFAGNGIIASSVVYENAELKAAIAAGQLPDETTFKAKVQKLAANHPGPVVIDIEYAYLSPNTTTTDAEVKQHFRLFITLAQWAHAAAPGHLVGYYGHGLFPEEPGKQYAAETKELLANLDAFFPSLYTHGNQTDAQWQQKLQLLIQKAHRIAPGKPVYPYVWAQYHEGGPKALEFLDAEKMKFQLATARADGADGVVFWSSSQPKWEDRPWVDALLEFVAAKPTVKTNVQFTSPAAAKTPLEPE
jgi:hypothetical protein